MNKIKNSMLFQMIAGAIILILLIVLFAKFDNTEIQDNSNKNNTINNEVENIIKEANKIEDITDSVKNNGRFYYGFVTKLSNNEIEFDKEGKKRKTKIENDMKFINDRTGEDFEFDNIKIGDYLHISKDDEQYCIYVARKIKGEELEKELLKNFAQQSIHIIGNSLELKNVEKVNSQKAIVTLEYGDSYWEAFDNEEKFEIKAIVNSNTKIVSKSNLSNSIDTIENSKNDMIMIKLDPKTINDENPVITLYESSDN